MRTNIYVANGLLLIACLEQALQAAPRVNPPEQLSSPTLAGTVEFRAGIAAQYDNPYDVDEIRVDALVAGPVGKKWTVPAFWFVPCAAERQAPRAQYSAIRLLRFFIAVDDFRKGSEIAFLLDDIELVDSTTGRTRAIEGFEKKRDWQAGSGVALERIPAGSDGKGHALRVKIAIRSDRGWPGLNLALPMVDWSGFDTLRMRFRPLIGLRRGRVMVEFYNRANKKFQHSIYQGTPQAPSGDWRTVAWGFRRNTPSIVWKVSEEKGAWHARIAVPTPGAYQVRFRATDRTGTAEGPPGSFHLERSDKNGFLRVDPGPAHRYLQFDSGAPYFAIGTNLLGRDTGTYEYYIPKFAAAGCNFVRFWMSGHTLGIERENPVQYDPVRAAMVDRLVDLSRENGVYLMFCLTDFREAGDRSSQHYWKQTAYSRLCRGPDEFFTGKAARTAYRKRLRYVVARWAASTHVHSWEFFNEVNITNAWRDAPETVRAWHREMSTFLRGIDPYRHLITSSFAGIEDDTLWDLPLMDVAQRHFYTTAFVSFADALSAAVRKLSAHGKPVLVGEFGRAKNQYADADSEGVSLHNGLWGAAMGGGSGTAMPWWWQWIDAHGLYRHFTAFAAFVRDVHWTQEEMHPAPTGTVAVLLKKTATTAPAGTIILSSMKQGSFKPAPFNRPVRIAVDRRGRMSPPDLLPGLLHGLRNHPDLHNPVTFVLSYPKPGTFSVRIGVVSGYGGAGLRIRVDDKPVLDKEFPDNDDGHEGIVEFAGEYTVPVPAGKHMVTVENTGRDWLQLPAVRLGHYGQQAQGVQVLALVGHRTVLVWVRNRGYTWFAPVLKQPLQPTPPTDVHLSKLPEGAWEASLFDPQTGTWTKRGTQLSRQADGSVRITVGPIRKDMAIRLTRLGPHH